MNDATKQFEHTIFVGLSLHGLMMGLALSRSCYTVTILERQIHH